MSGWASCRFLSPMDFQNPRVLWWSRGCEHLSKRQSGTQLHEAELRTTLDFTVTLGWGLGRGSPISERHYNALYSWIPLISDSWESQSATVPSQGRHGSGTGRRQHRDRL